MTRALLLAALAGCAPAQVDLGDGRSVIVRERADGLLSLSLIENGHVLDEPEVAVGADGVVEIEWPEPVIGTPGVLAVGCPLSAASPPPIRRPGPRVRFTWPR